MVEWYTDITTTAVSAPLIGSHVGAGLESGSEREVGLK